ncbi:hypothetical protein [Janthinobacterium sp. BJB401]|uniref:hypothetical protein n=1 Tax=Janthinobacterium sp. BJB401 TaxID=2745934 RepID=UPI001595605A|nr:hypothetical protein [Janthinobacterium sp. BJB401]NVI84467.1 hypothetical protein [Janthinobacterium sp. BJB401]
MALPLTRSFTVSLAALLLSMLSGCASFKSVDSFAQTGQQMTAAFPPIANATVDSCMNNELRRNLISTDGFDPAAAEQQARRGCDKIANSNQKILLLNSVLARYAQALQDLSGSKVADYHDQFSGLGDALGSIPVPGSGTPLLDPGQVSIVMKLSEQLSRLLTQNIQKSAINELLAQQEAIGIITNALNTYVQAAYRDRIAIERRDSSVLHMALHETARAEPLATNYVRVRLYRDEKQLGERAKIPDSYARAVKAFQESLDSLRKSRDDSAQLQQQLKDFSLRVDELKLQVAFLASATW